MIPGDQRFPQPSRSRPMTLGVDVTEPTMSIGSRLPSGCTVTVDLPTGSSDAVHQRTLQAMEAFASVMDGATELGVNTAQTAPESGRASAPRLSLLEAAGRLVALAADMAKGDGPDAGEALALATVAYRVESGDVDVPAFAFLPKSRRSA